MTLHVYNDLIQGTEDRARQPIIGGANALRTLAHQIEQRPDTSTWMHKDEVAELLYDAARVLDQAVPR